jgi:hypothetical protein
LRARLTLPIGLIVIIAPSVVVGEYHSVSPTVYLTRVKSAASQLRCK